MLRSQLQKTIVGKRNSSKSILGVCWIGSRRNERNSETDFSLPTRCPQEIDLAPGPSGQFADQVELNTRVISPKKHQLYSHDLEYHHLG